MEKITQTKYDEISECFDLIIKKYEKTFVALRDLRNSLANPESTSQQAGEDGTIPEIKLFRKFGEQTENQPLTSKTNNSSRIFDTFFYNLKENEKHDAENRVPEKKVSFNLGNKPIMKFEEQEQSSKPVLSESNQNNGANSLFENPMNSENPVVLRI